MKKLLLLFLTLSIINNTYSQEKFNGLANGPYKKLVIRGAMVIPGFGGQI